MPASRALRSVGVAALLGCAAAMHAEPPPPVVVSEAPAIADEAANSAWAALAADHRPDSCARCSLPAKPVPGVAELVRRVRRDAAAPRGARVDSLIPIDLPADVRHVAAASAEDRNRLIMRIADELAQRDVLAGARFAAALPNGRGQRAAMLVVFSVWMHADRAAALAWAHGLPDQGPRDAALDEATRCLVAAGVPDALALVSALPEGPGRDAAFCGVVRHWARQDRAAALAWVRGLTTSPQRARLLAVPEFASVPTEAGPE